jgi:hypothetical protein
MKNYLQLTLKLIVVVTSLLVARAESLWSARAQAAEKIWRIGFLSVTTRDGLIRSQRLIARE